MPFPKEYHKLVLLYKQKKHSNPFLELVQLDTLQLSRSEERRVGKYTRARNVTGVQTCALPIYFKLPGMKLIIFSLKPVSVKIIKISPEASTPDNAVSQGIP